MTDRVTSSDVTIFSDPIYQGEGKWFKFTVTLDGVVVSLTTATFSFVIKQLITDAATLWQASNFDTSLAANGIVRVNFPASASAALTPEYSYFGELTTTLFSNTDVDKKIVKFKLKRALDT